MHDEENPLIEFHEKKPDDFRAEQAAKAHPALEPEIVMAEFDESSDSVVEATLVNSSSLETTGALNGPVGSFRIPPPIQENLDNIAAKGGAVAAMVLGSWALIGAFITNWSLINALLGLVLGLWGLSSRHSRWAGIGMVLCVISLLLCLFGGVDVFLQSAAMRSGNSN
jgi:hypothetical protein